MANGYVAGNERAFPAMASEVEKGRYAFEGSGLDYFLLRLTNGLLSLVTLGFASLLGYTRWRKSVWLVEHTTLDGRPFRYAATWGDELGQSLLSALILVVTCGWAWPWVAAWHVRFRTERTVDPYGRRLRFDGSGWHLFLGALLAWPLLILTLGLAWPWVAAQYQSWEMEHTWVEDPSHPQGGYRLRFDAGGLAYLVQGTLSLILVQLTLGLYLPTAQLNYRRFVWASTSDAVSPRVKVPVGPRTPAQWALVVAMGAGAAALVLVVGGAVVFAGTAAHSAQVRHGGAGDPADLGSGPATPPRAVDTRDRGAGGELPPGPSEPAGAHQPEGSLGTAPGLAPGYDDQGLPEDIPEGRTPPPKLSEWSAAPVVKHTPDGCTHRAVRNWLKLNCSLDTGSAVPAGISGIQDMGGLGADYTVRGRNVRL